MKQSVVLRLNLVSLGCKCMYHQYCLRFAELSHYLGTRIKLLITSMDETGASLHLLTSTYSPFFNIFHGSSLLVLINLIAVGTIHIVDNFVQLFLHSFICVDCCCRDAGAISRGAPISSLSTSFITRCRHQILSHILGNV